MDLALSAEHEAVRELAAGSVDREIAPFAREWDRRESVDIAIVKKLGKLGFLGLTIPEELGGSGGDHLAYCLVMEELGRGDSSVRGIVSVSLGLVAKSIAAYGTPDQKAQWLPKPCADLIDRGRPFETEASMAKLFASEASVRAANNALQVFGGYGYVDEYPVAKYLRDARVTTLYEGTSQIQQLIIGRALTGVSAF
jgi:alkylation response protein AidB-like acyl-CoA dehydrogenase